MGVANSIKNYLTGSYAEMRKVSWPNKKQTTNYSMLVIGLSVGMALFFAVLDYVFSLGVTSLISK